MKKNVEIEAAEALLDVGVSLPFFKVKIPFKKRPIQIRLTMKRPCLGSQIKIAILYLKIGVTYEQMLEFSKDEEMAFMARHGKDVSRIIARTIVRGPISGLFAGVVAWLLRWFVPDEYIQGANTRFITLLGTKGFTNIIRSVQISNPLKPRLSQKQKGS